VSGINFLLGLVVVVAVPLGLRRIGSLGDPGSDRAVRRAAGVAVPCAVALGASLALEPGAVAGLLSLPWLAMAGLGAAGAAIAFVRDPSRVRPSIRFGWEVALGFLAFGGVNATANRFGLQPLGFAPTIVLLTAVHFHAAGFVLLAAGLLAYARRPGTALAAAIVLLVIGTVITAAGYVAVAEAIFLGAFMVAFGGLGIAVATIRVRRTLRSRGSQRLALVAGLGLLVSMPLAIAYAVGNALATPWLGLDVMIRTHGVLNVLAVALPISLAWALDARGGRPAGGPVDAIDVLWFNRSTFLSAPVIGILVSVAALLATILPTSLRVAMAFAGLVAIWWSIAAVLATWRVFGSDASRRWAWIRSSAGMGDRLNLTTGFDDTTSTLRGDPVRSVSIDIYDPSLPHESALRRARAAFPPPAPSVRLADAATNIGAGSYAAVLLLMSAHETHGEARRNLLVIARAALAPGGSVVLVEHLRDRANILAFGPGAWHFARRGDWLSVASNAGLELVHEQRLDPWVRGFVFAEART